MTRPEPMDAYEYLYRKVVYPAYERLRGRRTFDYVREYEANEGLSADALAALQWTKLRALLEHCQQNVPYYRRLWSGIGADWRDIRSLDDFALLPVLTKDHIRESYQELVASNWRGRTLRKSTGGSTGQPLTLEYTRESYERRTAVAMRGYAWAGARQGMRTVYVWGGDVAPVPRWQKLKTAAHLRAVRRTMLNSFYLSRDNAAGYIERLNRARPDVVVGYTQPLYNLARHALEHGLPVWRPKTVITGSEALLEFQREEISRAFCAPVFNTYGCREFMLLASECGRHEGLHVNTDHVVLELGSADCAGTGAVTVTDLHNYGMPFIRYVNGDLATPLAGRCACGRAFPRLARVDGRVSDTIRTRDGRMLPGQFFPHLLKEFRGILRYQVVQRREGDLVIRIVRGADFDPGALPRIESELRKVLGPDLPVHYDFVPEIPLTATGKHRVTVSEMAAP